MLSFDELWEKCESLYQDFIDKEDTQSIINELLIKLNLYKALDEKQEIPQEELEKIKSRTFGEILLTLTNLSIKDRINVFEALATAYKYRAVGYYSEKYET